MFKEKVSKYIFHSQWEIIVYCTKITKETLISLTEYSGQYSYYFKWLSVELHVHVETNYQYWVPEVLLVHPITRWIYNVLTIKQMWCKCVCKYCICDISTIVNESFIFTTVLMSPDLLTRIWLIVNTIYMQWMYVYCTFRLMQWFHTCNGTLSGGLGTVWLHSLIRVYPAYTLNSILKPIVSDAKQSYAKQHKETATQLNNNVHVINSVLWQLASHVQGGEKVNFISLDAMHES